MQSRLTRSKSKKSTISIQARSYSQPTIKSKRTTKINTTKHKSFNMSKRLPTDQIPQDEVDLTPPPMMEVTITADARTSNLWKKQKNTNNDNNNNNNNTNDRSNNNNNNNNPTQLVQLDLNSAQLTPDAGLDATTPLRHTPYTKQLNNKKKELWKTFTWMTKDIEKGYKTSNYQLKKAYDNGNMKEYRQFQFDQPYRTKHGICCVTGPIIPSPQQHNYRNKNEFTISYGIGEAKDEIDIGFLCGRFADGETRVGSPEGSLSCPEAVVEITRTVKKFLNTNPIAQKYTPWIKPDNIGLFRLLTIRDCPITKQLMISLQINPIAFTPEYNHLTSANPKIDNFNQLPDTERATLRREHQKIRDEKELENIQTIAMEEFSIAFRDFCIEEFYGGAIWRNPTNNNTNGFIPPHDSYDLTTENSIDLPMTRPPSYNDNFQYVNQRLYKPIPTIDNDTTIHSNGKAFTEKYNYSLASVIIQTHCGVANSAEMNALQNCVFGSHFIYTKLSNLFFRVSISSFLQVNIKAATSLYNVARHWAMAPKHDFNMSIEDVELKYIQPFVEIEQRFSQKLWDKELYKTSITPTKDAEIDPDSLIITPPNDLPNDEKPTVLFDVCCGTGTIGLLNSTSAQAVVGIDIVQSAIDDAKANATLNNINDTDFICGKAEDVMANVLNRYSKIDVERSVAILDPPRDGLHTKVLAALRESSLQRIVYISCNQKTLAEDVQRLVGIPSKSYPGQPFIPICALGFDLFPHTTHCEAIMLLERRPYGQGLHMKENDDATLTTTNNNNTETTNTEPTTTTADTTTIKTDDV